MTDPTRTTPAPDAAGFTLVELMLTLVIIAIGVLALSGVQTKSSHDVYSTGRHERALALAQERIELARATGYAVVAADSGQSGVFAWNTQVDSIALDLKQVGVTVSWTENASPRSLRLLTLMSAR
jgi:prepilin-type N-terminal cleavage/methylation domain-containing protein